jgi:glyoxylase I family protein
VAIAVRGLCPLISVFDMPTSLHFYRDVVGFSEVAKSGQGDNVGWAWLRHGGDACLGVSGQIRPRSRRTG